MLRKLTRTLTAAAVLCVVLLAAGPPVAVAAAAAEPRATTDRGGVLSWLWAPLERLLAAVIAPEPPPAPAPAGEENSDDGDEGPTIDPNG